MDLETLARQPLAEQCRALDALIRRTSPVPVLNALARWADPAPFEHVLRTLLTEGRVPDGLADALAAAPDAHLGRVLRGLPDPTTSPTIRAQLVQRIVDAADRLPPERVAAATFLLRWIARVDPQRARALRLDALDRAQSCTADPPTLDPRTFLRLPGAAYADLEGRATSHGQGAAWSTHLAHCAGAMLDALEAQPKSLSQVGAEELLSRRVYTDAAHFLMELVQNAEDADATRWALTVEPDRLIVEHDGTPFDARDVVGVLSIGQTTKSGERIGFFGVGFKSVYAVTDRPRITSGPFDFEIADVSVPRRLDGDATGAGTRLVLPLRDPHDPATGHAAIGARARALPATLLLTLRHIRQLRITVGGRTRTVERRMGDDGAVELVDGGRISRWWVLTERTRGAEAVDATLVAVLLDDAGRPTPLPADAPSVFCFLPTRDRPGLRVLVHARFPLPVDRERVDVHAPATTAALKRAGALICARALELQDPLPLMALLPLPDEVQPPAWQALRHGFAEAAAGRPLIPAPGGARVALTQARRAPAALARGLAGVTLLGPTAAPFELVSTADARADHMLASLGVPRVDADDLLRMLDAHGPEAPSWLARAAGEVLAFIAQSADLLTRARTRSAGLLAPDDDGRWQPAEALARCPGHLRPFFVHRALVCAALADDARLDPLWRAFAVPVLDDDAVAGALRDPTVGPTICARMGLGVLAWMAGQPLARLVDLAHLPIVPDDRGRRGPITGGAPLPAAGPLGRWARRFPEARPSLVTEDVAAAHGPLLRSLGAATFDVDRLLDGLPDGPDGTMPEAARDALHGALDALAPELSRRQLDQLARATLFTDVHGMPRRLRGRGAAIVPLHPELEPLLPDGPWLAVGLRGARHVRAIEPTAVAESAVVEGLIDPDTPLGAPPGSPRWQQLATWIVRHQPSVDRELREAAARAPIWSGGGERRPLDALRVPPSEPAWAALYDRWAHWPAPDADARSLGLALGLPGAHPTPAAQVALDIAAMVDADDAWLEAESLPAALAALASALGGDALRPLAERWLYPDEAGVRRPLAGFGDAEGVRPVEPHWRPVLRDAEPLLDADWQRALASFPDAIGCPPAGLPAALRWAESGGHLPDEAWRAALVAQRSWTDEITRRVSALAIWPTTRGDRVPATALCVPSRVAPLPEEVADWIGGQGTHALDPSATAHADALADRLHFASPVAALVQRILADARPGEPLSAQPSALSTPAAVARIRALLGPRAEGLPLRIDLAGRLTAEALFAADADARSLAAELPLAARIVHPDDDVGDPQLPARRVLAALADARAEEGLAVDHPVLERSDARAALYRLLVTRADEIDGDEQARGQLGRAAAWLTRDGILRRPRGLLLIDVPDDIPALAARCPSDEIPPGVLERLRGWFRLDARHLRTAVEHVLDALRAVDTPSASARLVAVLAEVLDAATADDTPLEALVGRFKLHRQLKIADASGHWTRARGLFVPLERAQAERVARFHPNPPPRPHPDYGAAVEPLLRAAGAVGDLDDETLTAGLADPLPGLDAGLARVAYLARRAEDEPTLVERLDLAQRSWLIDRQGEPCAPAELDWPDPDLDALIGPDGGRRPHPAVVHAIGDALRARLPLKTALDADPQRVAERLREGEPMPVAVMRWFDAALDDRRITPEQARQALADRRVLADDDGICRRPAALVRDLDAPGLGRRRGGFSDGRPVPRFVGALGIPATVDTRARAAWLAEVAADVRRGRTDLLITEPELRGLLPQVVGAQAADEAERPALLLAATPGGDRLYPIDDPRLTWPWPPELAAVADGAAIHVAIVDASDGALAWAAQAWGLPTVADRWRAETSRPPMGTLDPTLDATLVALWQRLPRLLGRDPAAERPPSARVVADAGVPGRIGDLEVVWPRRARLVGDRLLVVADTRPAEIAAALWRDGLRRSDESEDDPIVQRLARLLACGHGTAMDLLLDAEGRMAPRPAAPPRRPTTPKERPAQPPNPESPRAEPPTAPVTSHAPDPADDDGLLGRLKRWWRGDEPSEPPPPPRPPEPTREATPDRPRPAPRPPRARADDDPGFHAPDTTQFFRPQQAVDAQLHANANWLATRQTPTEIGFAFAPSRLAGVHQYGPALIADRFDPRSRRWTSAAVDPAWSRPLAGGGFRVAFSGRLTTGEAALAVPLFGEVVEVRADGVRRMQGRDGRPLLLADRPTDVRYVVELSRAPRYVEADPPRVAALLAPTVPDSELPAECHDLVGALLDAPPRARISGIGQFVRQHYRYDPRYLEDPDHARWLRRVTRGRANVHIAALHAGRDGRHLGAGVCYELNTLVCELARRAGVPAAIASGWTFDRGWVDQPDHLWAMALLATEDGPRWLPVDASSTQTGRPLHAAPRPPGPHRAEAPRQNRPAPAPVDWSDVRAPATDTSAPLRELLRVIRHLERFGSGDRDEAARLEAARTALTDPARARALLAAVEGHGGAGDDGEP